MARKRYTAAEVLGHRRTVEIEMGRGLGIAEACRKLGVTEQNCGPNCSTANSSIRCTKPKSSLNAGAVTTITMRTARIVRWGIDHRSQRPACSHRAAYRGERTDSVA